MVSFSNFHFTKRERCFSVKNEIFQEKILALSRLSTNFQGAKVELWILRKYYGKIGLSNHIEFVRTGSFHPIFPFGSELIVLRKRAWLRPIVALLILPPAGARRD